MEPIYWDDSVDIVIVGSGFAGLAAAIEAAQAGCSVLVIEKRDSYGGNSWISGGVLAAIDLECQRRYGIEDSAQRMLDDMMKAGRGVNNPKLVELICMRSYATLQWLKQELGVAFMDRVDQFGGHSVPRCYSVVGIQGQNIINLMLKRATQLNVKIRLNTCMEQFCQAKSGEIIGITAINTVHQDRLTIRLKANQAVILASGGFSGEEIPSQPLMSKTLLHTSLADSTAEVLQQAKQIGAELLDMQYIQMLPCASPDEPGRGVAPVFASYVVFPYGFMVNPTTGQRFVNEWTDRKTRADAMIAGGQPAIGITDHNGLANVGDMIHEHMDETVIKRFNHLTTLSDYYQIPYKPLQKTLITYNQYVQQKQDDAFGKPIPTQAKPLSAPYYAIRLWPKAHSSMGGVRINAQAAVLNQTGQIIPHLYAAGEVTGGIHGVSRLAGCAITECLVFGRIAGQQAALPLTK